MKLRSSAAALAAASLFCLLGHCTAWASENPGGRKLLVVFRFDDFCEKSATTGFEADLLNDFTRHKIPCTFAVIPYVCSNDVHNPGRQPLLALDSSKASFLKPAIASGIIEVAQHGLSHQTLPGRAPGEWTEFGGRPLPEQIDRIEQGRKLLTELFAQEPKTFVPPWNAYDRMTLQAAQRCGFRVFSGNGRGPGQQSSLQFVPATTTPLELQSVCKAVRKGHDPHPLVVVLFHEYDFREVDPVKGCFTQPEFSRILDWVAAQPDIETTTLGQINGADFSRYAAFRSLQRVRRLLPSSLLHVSGLDWPVGSYPSLGSLQQFTRRFWVLLFPLYLGLLGGAVFGGHVVNTRLLPQPGKSVLPPTLVVGSCLVWIILAAFRSVTAKDLCLAVTLVGFSVSSWLALLKRAFPRASGVVFSGSARPRLAVPRNSAL